MRELRFSASDQLLSTGLQLLLPSQLEVKQRKLNSLRQCAFLLQLNDTDIIIAEFGQSYSVHVRIKLVLSIWTICRVSVVSFPFTACMMQLLKSSFIFVQRSSCRNDGKAWETNFGNWPKCRRMHKRVALEWMTSTIPWRTKHDSTVTCSASLKTLWKPVSSRWGFKCVWTDARWRESRLW